MWKLLFCSDTNCNDKPVLNNGTYWYLTGAYSFGFSPIYNIRQYDADVYDCDSSGKNCKDDNRLSLVLGISAFYGKSRLGKLTINEGTVNTYRKILMVY